MSTALYLRQKEPIQVFEERKIGRIVRDIAYFNCRENTSNLVDANGTVVGSRGVSNIPDPAVVDVLRILVNSGLYVIVNEYNDIVGIDSLKFDKE